MSAGVEHNDSPLALDPAHPERAFLDETPTSAPMVFIVVGLLLIPVAWFGSRLV